MSQTYISADLRRLVRQRAANGCEYCLLPESFSFFVHEIDHIVSERHSGPTAAENLALACLLCNKYKSGDLTSIDPQTGRIEALFHPRNDHWSDHFRLVGGSIEPLTPTGRVTARLLRFNQPERVAERLLLVEFGAIRPPSN